MKTSDLVVGTDYAYNPRPNSRWMSEVHRVTVLATGVKGKDGNARGFRARDAVTNGLVEVEFVTGSNKGESMLVKPVTVIKTWSEHHAEATAAGKAKAERARKEAAELAENAALAFALHQKMLAAGVPLESESVYDDKQHAAMLEAGFKTAPALVYGYNDLFTTFDVTQMLEKGTVPLKVVKVLMGEKPTVTKWDGLGSLDLDYLTETDPEGVAEFVAAYEAASKVGA